jgi:hypothetical protein
LATPPISNDLTLSKNEEPRFILTQSFFLNYLIIKLMGSIGWYDPAILQNTILLTICECISNPF